MGFLSKFFKKETSKKETIKKEAEVYQSIQYGNINMFGLIALTDDDKISIPDMSNKLDKLLVYLQTWNEHDLNTKWGIYSSIKSFLSAAGHYFKQQGMSYWRKEQNRDELFKFLTLYGDAVYFAGVCSGYLGAKAVALSYAKDAYRIFPPEHIERHQFENKIKNTFIADGVRYTKPIDIDDCSDYLYINIDKFLR